MSDSPKVSFFKKGKTRPTSTRQRSPPRTSSPTTTADSEVVIPTRKAGARILSQGTKRLRQEEEEHEGVDVNWAGGSTSNVNAAMDILEGDAAEDLLARKRAKLEEQQEGEDGEDGPDDGLYKGQAGYRNRIAKGKEVPKRMRVGPQKSASTIRTVTIVDYQPDVCKDYKETGFCGFGDTCKFLHDRGTYLAGWQLDKLAADGGGGGETGGGTDSESDEDIPFACLICRKPYTDPVVTRCGHYFCSGCAIKRFAKTPKCLACGVPTGGIFNRADKVIEKLKEKGGGEDDVEEESRGELAVEGLSDGEESEGEKL